MSYKVVLDEQASNRIQIRGANRQLLSCRDTEVMLAGPAETGKSFVCCVKLHLTCLKYPNSQHAMLRKTFGSIAGTVGKTFERVSRGANIQKYGGEIPTRYIYPNGATIWIGGMDKTDKVLSAERDTIYVCQAEELTLDEWETLTTRCTGRGAVVKWPQMMGDCNPSGSSHWIRKRAKDGKLTLLNAVHRDNPTLYDTTGNVTAQGKKSLAVLDSLTGVRRLRLRDGIWATAEGAVYEMFSATITGQPSDHVQVRPRSEFTTFYLALDDGFTNPAVILDIGSDSDGRWHIFREFYRSGWVQDDVAAEAKKWHDERRTDLAAVDEAAAGLIEALKRKGVPAVAGKGRIFDGIAKIQERLKVQRDGRPRLTLDPSCVNTINEFESYAWKPEKDVPIDADNHAVGALRYLADALDEPTGAWSADAIASAVGGSAGEELDMERLVFEGEGLTL